MILTVDVRLDYKIQGLATALLQIEAAAQADQRILDAATHVDHPKYLARVAAEDGVGERSWLRIRDHLVCTYKARVEIDRPAIDLRTLSQVPTHQLPGDVVKYVIGSRFIHSEKFEAFAQAEFGKLSGGARIAEMRDWVEAHLDYVSGSSDADTTASDTFIQRQGICRDYSHLMIALARASQIPARMVSVYAPDVDPPDFHAVTEVYLDSAWHLVDATGMAPADTIARIGVGRDAADIPFMMVFAKTELRDQSVSVNKQ